MCVWVGVFGLLIGSFLNVVIWRVPRAESILTPSKCPKCETKIKPHQNIPIFSWLFLRGKCASCKTKISARYPLVELFTGIFFAAVTYWAVTYWDVTYWDVSHWGSSITLGLWLSLAAYLWFAAISVALTLIDIELQRLPDAIVVPSFFVVAGLLVIASWGDWGRIVQVLIGAAALFVFYFVIVVIAPGSMGGGDLKLAPVIGAALGFLGWAPLIVGAFLAFLFGGIYGVALLVLRRAGRKTGVPFGPFMLLGAWVAIFWGDAIAGVYLRVAGIA